MKETTSQNNGRRHRRAMTAVEVVASTVLASMLMVAVIGVLRGLKAQEDALDLHILRPRWHTTFEKVLGHDLALAHEYELTRQRLTLYGYGGRDPQTRLPNWQPAVISYELVPQEESTWLVRSEFHVGGGPPARELVLSGVGAFRFGMAATSPLDQLATTTNRKTPLNEGMPLELYDATGKLVYAYRHQTP